MTKYEGAVFTAYTGITCGDFASFHKYAEKILGRNIFSIEFASAKLAEEIKNKSRADFMRIVSSQTGEVI